MRTVYGGPRPSVEVPRLLAAGLGVVLQAADAMVEFGGEGATAVVIKGRTAVNDASALLGRAADTAADWTARQLACRVARAMTPYLVDELVPEVVDGVMPKIRADVIPVVIDDLAADERIRAMVAQQSMGTLGWSVTEARRTPAEADDRVESALHRLLGRRVARP